MRARISPFVRERLDAIRRKASPIENHIIDEYAAGKITRRDFGLHADNPSIRVAILNRRWSGPISDNEHWFFAEREALEWLTLE